MHIDKVEELNLIAVAKRQRELLWIVLVAILSYPIAIGAAGVSPVASLVLFAFQLLAQLVGLVQLIRLFGAMQTSLLLRILYIPLMLIPLINLVILLVGSSQATSMLKMAGAKVGLMGVHKSEYPKLRDGHCRGCGYDRTGLEMLQECPECGRVPRVG